MQILSSYRPLGKESYNCTCHGRAAGSTLFAHNCECYDVSLVSCSWWVIYGSHGILRSATND